VSRRVLVLAKLSRSLLNFRGPLLRALCDRGHEVIVAAPEDEGSKAAFEALAAHGIRFEVVPLARGGLKPGARFR